MPRVLATACAALAGAALLLAGCGDTTTVQVTVTQHTGSTAAPPPVTTTTPVTTTANPETTPTKASLELRLPAQDIIPSLRPGTPENKTTAASMVNALYAAGDAAIPAATSRLRAAGYEQGVLRDQRGADPTAGLTLFRIYIYRVRDAATAQTEVDNSVTEVKASSSAPSAPVEVPGITGAKGLALQPVANGQKAQVLYVTWAAGRDVYGMQAFATGTGRLYRPKILDLAKSLYLAWNNVP